MTSIASCSLYKTGSGRRREKRERGRLEETPNQRHPSSVRQVKPYQVDAFFKFQPATSLLKHWLPSTRARNRYTSSMFVSSGFAGRLTPDSRSPRISRSPSPALLLPPGEGITEEIAIVSLTRQRQLVYIFTSTAS